MALRSEATLGAQGGAALPDINDQGHRQRMTSPATLDAIRPSLRQTDDERARRLAEARRAINDHHLAVEAVRLLEGVAAGPKVHRPRVMAQALRELAEHFEAVA